MSFWEFFVVFVVGIIVIGPDKLPEAIRTGMLWFGRIKRTVTDTRAEFEQQLGIDEIRRELHNERVLESLRKLEEARDEVRKSISDAEAEVEDIASAVDDDIRNIAPRKTDLAKSPAEPEQSTAEAVEAQPDEQKKASE